MKGRAVLFGGLMLVTASASAQGVFSFDDIPLEGEPTVEVNMGPEMIALFGEASKGVPGGPGPLDGITNVRVLVYEDIAEDMQAVLKFVDSTATKLEGDGWHAVVRVRDEGEQVRVYMKPGAGGDARGCHRHGHATAATTAAAARPCSSTSPERFSPRSWARLRR